MYVQRLPTYMYMKREGSYVGRDGFNNENEVVRT